MSWLTPLGLLGLLGIAILILIYLLKPNYQQKIISSTHIWKLSLRYRRKKVPINRFRNILIFLCQALIITACALILAQPFLKTERGEDYSDSVAVVDSSAGMLVSADGKETRFQRAIDGARSLMDRTFEAGGLFTLILASPDPDVLVQRANSDSRAEIEQLLSEAVCSYGEADLDAAMELARPVLNENPSAQIHLFTGTTYYVNGTAGEKSNVTVEDVRAYDAHGECLEWNAAILGVEERMEENYYVFAVDVACFGRDRDLTLAVDIVNANGYDGEGETISFTVPVECFNNETVSVVIRSTDYERPGIASYDSVYLRFNEVDDSLKDDNAFYLYGGKRESVRIQLWSADPNSFFYIALSNMQSRLRSTREIVFDNVEAEDEPLREGYDLYIYEHALPASVLAQGLPTDGVVFLADPDISVEGLGITFDSEEVRLDSPGVALSAGEQHPLTDYITPEWTEITRYKRVLSQTGFSELLFCGGDPVLLSKNEGNAKLIVMPFSVNNSTMTVNRTFQTLLYNILTYYFPLTTEKYVFDFGETASLRARADSLTVVGPEGTVGEYSVFPAEVGFPKPGSYTLIQTPISLVPIETRIFVRISADESRIFREEDLVPPVAEAKTEEADVDLLVWFAAALVALLFVEWWLQARENFG